MAFDNRFKTSSCKRVSRGLLLLSSVAQLRPSKRVSRLALALVEHVVVSEPHTSMPELLHGSYVGVPSNRIRNATSQGDRV